MQLNNKIECSKNTCWEIQDLGRMGPYVVVEAYVWMMYDDKHVHTKLSVYTKTMPDAPTKQKLWGGRFTGSTDPLYVNH